MFEELIRKVDLKIKEELEKVDELERLNSEKVLNAFLYVYLLRLTLMLLQVMVIMI